MVYPGADQAGDFQSEEAGEFVGGERDQAVEKEQHNQE